LRCQCCLHHRVDGYWVNRSSDPFGDNVTELVKCWLEVTGNDTPKSLRSEPTANLSEVGSLSCLLLLDAVKDGSNVIEQFDCFALEGVVVSSSVVARDCGCCSAVVASAGGSESPGAAAGRADELGESAMLNSRSKESTTRCIAVS